MAWGGPTPDLPVPTFVTSTKTITRGVGVRARSRVEMFERIRKDHRDEGLSIRALAARHEVHRRTVRQALADATPPPRKVAVRESPVLGAYRVAIRAWPVSYTHLTLPTIYSV